jgi:hypothetical protein
MPRELPASRPLFQFSFSLGVFDSDAAGPVPPAPVPPMTLPNPPADAPSSLNGLRIGGCFGDCDTPAVDVIHPCDVIRVVHPQRVPLAGGVSTCGTFQHAPPPQPLHFLLSQPGSIVIGIGAVQAAEPDLCIGAVERSTGTFLVAYGVNPPSPSGSTGKGCADPLVEHVPAGVAPSLIPCGSAAPTANPLLGTWYRDIGVGVLVVTFTADEMKLCITPREANPDGNKALTVTLTAHYTLTKDGLVYGAVTGADVDSKAGLDKDDADLLAAVQGLADRPFSFRAKHTSVGMMVSGLKCSMPEGREEAEMRVFGGLYKFAKDGQVPVAVAPKGTATPAGYGAAPAPPGVVPASEQQLTQKGAGMPLVPPIRAGEPLPICEEPPSDAEVLRAMRRVVCEVPFCSETFRDDVVIVKNRLVDKIDPPRYFPLVGQAQLHHCHWECVVYYTELTQFASPFPVYLKKPRTQVIYIDKDFLHLYDGPIPRQQSPADDKASGSGPGYSVRPLSDWTPTAPSQRPDAKLNAGGLTAVAPLAPAVPCVPPPVAPAVPQPKPGFPGDAMKLMACDAFGQLLQQSGATRPVFEPALPPNLEQFPQYFSPNSAFTCPSKLAAPEVAEGAVRGTCGANAAAKSGVIGTWYRDIAGKQTVVRLAADHMTVTITEAHEIDGQTVTLSTIFTFDYQFMRDGTTAVGLIANVDIKVDGELSADDLEDVTDQLSELQKALEDKSFAMTVRLFGDALVIGNVRLPDLGDKRDLNPTPFISGRYKNVGDKPLPKLKAIKATPPQPPVADNPAARPPLGSLLGGLGGASLGGLGLEGTPNIPPASAPMPHPACPAEGAPKRTGQSGSWFLSDLPQCAPACVAAPGPDCYPLNSRIVKLPVEYKRDRSKICQVALYVARGGASTWDREGSITPDQDSFVYVAKEDGVYWFKMVIEYRNGTKEPADLAVGAPDLKAVIDTTPPVARVTNASRADNEIVIEWAIEDKFPNDAETKVHFCTTGDPRPGWQQVTRPANAPGGVRFPCGTADAITVKITATDLAGNTTEITQDFPAAGAGQPRIGPKTTTSVMPAGYRAGCGTSSSSAKHPAGDEPPPPLAEPNGPVPARQGLVGTWYREVGPMMCVIKIEADHLTVTAFAIGLVDGKEVKQGAVLTADYHLSRNGTTLVGLITGLDLLVEGGDPEKSELLEALTGDMFGRIQKAAVDHPYAFNVRVYGDALMIGNVKLPMADDEATSFVPLFAGRYKSAGSLPVPNPKPIQGKAVQRLTYPGGMTLPSPRYLEHFPQYFPPEHIVPAGGPVPSERGITSESDYFRRVEEEGCRYDHDQPETIPPTSQVPVQTIPPTRNPVIPASGSEPAVPSMPYPTKPGVVIPAGGAVPSVPGVLSDSDYFRRVEEEGCRYDHDEQPNALRQMVQPVKPAPAGNGRR